MKPLFAIFFISLVYLGERPLPYTSPGLQIGISNDGIFFLSFQNTIGLAVNEHSDWAFPVMAIGVTIGRRIYFNKKINSMTYLDLQTVLPMYNLGTGYSDILGHSGIGIGIINNGDYSYARLKLFTGLLGYITYDAIGKPIRDKNAVNTSKHNFGIIGVCPIGNWLEWL